MSSVLLVFVVGVFGLALFVLHLWAIIDVVKTPEAVWTQAQQNQIVWALVVLFFSLVGPVLYIVIARPALLAARGSAIG